MEIIVSEGIAKDYLKLVTSFKSFIKDIFWLSFEKYTPAPHLDKWADELQYHNNTAILSARKHLKSTITYAYLMWLIWTTRDKNLEILYLSFKEDLARYHVANIKKYINSNPRFLCKDLTHAESEAKYSWDYNEYEKIRHTITIHPAGVTSFKRGYHPDIVICDDILADPSQELNLTVIDKINRVFFEDVMSLPKEGGQIKLVGTAQHQEDLFFKLKDKKNWSWSINPAIIDEIEKKTLWPELFSYERLLQIRDEEVGTKAFNKEYLCFPVWSEDAFFKREEIMQITDPGLNNLKGIEAGEVYGGFDIGKVRHPSHFTLFLESQGLKIQIYQIFMDGWDYTRQVEFINALIDPFKIKKIYYDATRGELDSFAEQKIIHPAIWKPIKFTSQVKFKLAGNFSKAVSNRSIRLQSNARMIRSILSVNNDLDALETADGHGDVFWSVAMALSHRKSEPITIVGGGRYKDI